MNTASVTLRENGTLNPIGMKHSTLSLVYIRWFKFIVSHQYWAARSSVNPRATTCRGWYERVRRARPQQHDPRPYPYCCWALTLLLFNRRLTTPKLLLLSLDYSICHLTMMCSAYTNTIHPYIINKRVTTIQWLKIWMILLIMRDYELCQ